MRTGSSDPPNQGRIYDLPKGGGEGVRGGLWRARGARAYN